MFSILSTSEFGDPSHDHIPLPTTRVGRHNFVDLFYYVRDAGYNLLEQFKYILNRIMTS